MRRGYGLAPLLLAVLLSSLVASPVAARSMPYTGTGREVSLASGPFVKIAAANGALNQPLI